MLTYSIIMTENAIRSLDLFDDPKQSINRVVAEYIRDTIVAVPHHEDEKTWTAGCLISDEYNLPNHPTIRSMSFRKIPGYGFGLPSVRKSPSAHIDSPIINEDAYVLWVRFNRSPGALLRYQNADGSEEMVWRHLSQFNFSLDGHQYFFHSLVGLSDREKSDHFEQMQNDEYIYSLSEPLPSPKEGAFKVGSWQLTASDPSWYEFLFTALGDLRRAYPEQIGDISERMKSLYR